MMRHLLITLFLIIAFGVQACSQLKTPDPEEPCHFQQNSFKQRVSWATLPVRVYAHSSLSEEQIIALREAINIWNLTRAGAWGDQAEAFFELQADIHTGAPFVDDRKVVVSITDSWTGDPREQAETILRWEGDRAVDSDIRLNGEKPLATTLPLLSHEIDLVALYVHELGHVLGLVHIDSAQYSVMGFELERGTDNRRTPGNLELDALRCEY